MPTEPSQERRSVAPIQGLRAAAALAVCVHHALYAALWAGGGTAQDRFPGLSWDAGIDVFFVVSGFVMVYASEPLFAAPGGARRFAARRLARIVPLYWAASAAYLASALLLGGVHAPLGGPAYVTASLLFIPWPRPDGVMHPLYEVGWTLNYEMLFYAVFAAFIALPRRPAVLCVAAVLAAGVAAAPAQPQLRYWTDPIVLEFAFGMAAACLLREGAVLSMAARGLMLAAAGALLAALGLAMPDLSRCVRFGVPAALAVAAAALGPEPAMPRPAKAAMVALGDASYALYLVHPFVLRALQIAWPRLAPPGPAAFWSYVAASVAASAVAALAVHAWIEAPATCALKARLAGPRVTPRPAPL